MRWENTVTIEAPAESVWQLTVNVEHLPAITPTITRVVRLDDGPIRVGSRARIKQPRQPDAIWTVTRLDEGRSFTWQTKRFGLTMIGSHELEPMGARCRNTLTLDVEGPGSALFGRLLGRQLSNAIATENAGFQATAQRGPAS